jgi:kynurenine 3-monooxygenase
VWDIDLPEAKIYTGESEKSEWKEYQYDHVFGADGAFSRVRHKMQRQSRFNYSQHFIDVGYKELTIPPIRMGAISWIIPLFISGQEENSCLSPCLI